MSSVPIRGGDYIILALDTRSVSRALRWTIDYGLHVGGVKIGLGLTMSVFSQVSNPYLDFNEVVGMLREWRMLTQLVPGKVFLDVKGHDIGNTIKDMTQALAELGPRYINVHASAGVAGIRAMVENVKPKTKVLAVTVLTSHTRDECVSIFGADPGQKVIEFTDMARRAGAAGVVCSAQELEQLSQVPEFRDLEKIVPGTRSAGIAANDQARVMTPYEAMRLGATALVVGRQLTEANDTSAAYYSLSREIAHGIQDRIYR